MLGDLNRAAYESTFRGVREALRRGDPLAVAAAAMSHLDGSMDGFHRLSGASVDCRAGCSFCCWLRIDVRAHEVFLIARFMASEAVPGQRDGMESSVREAAARVHGVSYSERQSIRQPCGLLDHAGCCRVYAVRPAACRRYLSVSVDACESIWDGRAPAVEPEHPMIAELGRHTANGAHNAFIAEGYDGYSYDLMAALAEALADPECEGRWRLKQPAFSAAARSTVPGGFSQDEALVRLRAELAGP